METFTYKGYHIEVFRSFQDSRHIVATVNKIYCPLMPYTDDLEVASHMARTYVNFVLDVNNGESNHAD
jgi:hypothetical protein